MDYLFARWDEIKKELSNKFIFLFLDYDGTLTPIVETPNKALMPQEIRELLKKFLKSSDYALAIISGRSLNDIKNIVGLKKIIYVGNHGLEIDGPKIKFESRVSSRLKSIIRRLYEDMKNKLTEIKGVLIEDKGLSISIHHRLVDRKDLPLLQSIFTEIINPYVKRDRIKIDSGKEVYEIKPSVKWDKGKVVLWLLARQQFVVREKPLLPIYIGDDATDEDAFKVLENKGLTIFVGKPKPSYARYYLKNTKEVAEFLHKI